MSCCLPALCGPLLLAGCTNFMELRQGLQESQTELGRIAGTVISPSCADCPTILAALADSEGHVVHTDRIYEQHTPFQRVVGIGRNLTLPLPHYRAHGSRTRRGRLSRQANSPRAEAAPEFATR